MILQIKEMCIISSMSSENKDGVNPMYLILKKMMHTQE